MKPRNKTWLYTDVTNRIIAELEEGRLPWAQPWSAEHLSAPLGLPKNAGQKHAFDGRAYSGINILILWDAAAEHIRSTQRWLTFKQAQTLGGTVRKGEKGVTVCYADRFTPKTEIERAAEAGDEPQKVVFLKRYTVFNVDQCEGLADDLYAEPAPLPEGEIIPHAEAVIATTGADIRIGGAKAFYNPALDFIAIPPQQAFFEQINFYRTAFHELSHWTGHKSRLDREFAGKFGSEAYAREELIAELSAAFICAELGIRPTVRHADYIGAWLEVLREDDRAIFRAASLASKAAEYINKYSS